MPGSKRHKRIARMHALRDQAARWAERQHPELLERFFAARPPRSRVERTLADAWRTSWFGVFEVVEVAPGRKLVLEDVPTDREFTVREESASTMISPGAWGLLFIVSIDGQHELLGTSLLLSLTGRIAAAAESWSDLVHHDDSGASWIGRHVEPLSGPLPLAGFNAQGPGEGSAVLSTNSRERPAAFRALWQERTGTALPVIEDELEAKEVDSNPDGTRVEVDGGVLPSDGRDWEEAEEDFLEHLAAHWIDEPTPALGGASPRQAVEAGRRAEVRALFPTKLPEDLLWELRDELEL